MAAENDAVRVRGACLCGAVQFSFDLPTLFCVHCHCTMCQRANGAGYVTWVGAGTGGFSIDAGEAELARHASSEHGSRSFCSLCGSSMFCENDAHPEQVDVTLANVIDAVDKPPQFHVYFSDRATWVEVNDELPRLGGETGMEPLKDE